MKFTNEMILNNIKLFGLDRTVDQIEPHEIEDITIQIIFRTIRDSKTILVERLMEFVEEESQEKNEPMEG